MWVAFAGVVSILRFLAPGRLGETIAGAVWIALAVWFKFTTALLYPAYLALWWPARPRRPLWAAGAAVAFMGLTVLPSAAWIAYGRLTHQTLGSFYQRDWDVRGIIEVLIELPLMVGTHMCPLGFVLLLLGFPVASRCPGSLRNRGI